jgi:hypothetical protein
MGMGYSVFAFIAVFVVTVGVALLLLWFDPVYRRLRGMGEVTSEATRDVSVLRWADPAVPVPQWSRTLQ